MIAARTIGALLVSLVVTAQAFGQSLPTLTGPVNDFAHVIDPASAQELDRRIRALDAATHDAVVVVTIETFQPYGSIEEYAVRLYEHAGIGQKGKDNGVLVLLAVKDRRARIEVGYDLEQFITDGFAGETIRQVMLPAFREQRYGPGLLAGTTRVIQRVADRRGVTLSEIPTPPKRAPEGPGLVGGLVIAFVLILIISRIFRRRGPPRFRGPWGGSTWSGWHGGIGGFGGGFGGFGGGFGGGGGGGGFGGFGGGRSGGGGASGGW